MCSLVGYFDRKFSRAYGAGVPGTGVAGTGVAGTGVAGTGVAGTGVGGIGVGDTVGAAVGTAVGVTEGYGVGVGDTVGVGDAVVRVTYFAKTYPVLPVETTVSLYQSPDLLSTVTAVPLASLPMLE